MNVPPQPDSRSTRLQDFGTTQADISTIDTQEVARIGSAIQQSMQYPNDKAGSTHRETQQRVKDKKRTSKKFYLILLILLLLCSIVSGASVIGYETFNASYHKYMSLAQTGVQHLRTATKLLETLPKNPFEAAVVGQARREFVDASTDFAQLDASLKSLPETITVIPVYGSRLSTALHLVPLAFEVSQSGIVGCDALSLLISRFHDPLNAIHGLTMTDLSVLAKDLHQLKATLNLAVEQVNALQPGDLQFDPRLGQIFTTFHRELPTLQTWLDQAEKFLKVAPTLLGIGMPTNYLLEMLDSTELRPGGGFIGNYGIVTLSGGQLTSAHITDVYLFDGSFEAAGHSISYPLKYSWFDLAPGSWSLRDSNLDADFPTAARYAEQNYRLEGGDIPVQGVIAITPALIQQALAIVGPIAVPEYHETVTAQNLIDRIHYHQVGAGREGNDTPSPDGHSSVRKHFTEVLAEHFLARAHQLSASVLPKLLQLFISSLHSKDVQIYLNSSVAESMLQPYHFDASIQSPPGDSLFVVDANISPNKANQFITNTVNDQVTIDAHGNASHLTTINYAWMTNGPVNGASLYRDYVRVYAPASSILQMQSGWQPRGISKAFGRQVWAGFFTLSYGQARSITLKWTVSRVATKGAEGWHYQYLIQRQAGSHWTLHLQILPFCPHITNKSGGLVSGPKQVAELTQTLYEDVNVGVDFSC